MKKIFMILAFLTSLFSGQSQTFQNFNSTDFKKSCEKSNSIVLDVRTSREFNKAHIKNAININVRDSNSKKEYLKLDKNKEICIYCYSGARSRYVAKFLVANGYTKIYNLQRGIIEWNNYNYPTISQTTNNNSPKIKSVSLTDFNKIISNNNVVLVDFYAEWCAPCKKMMPAIDMLKEQYKDRIKVVKINSDESKELCKAKNITSLPSLFIYKNGEKVWEKFSVTNYHDIKKEIDKQLAN